MKKKLFITPHFKFKDKRGMITGIFNNYNIQESNIITSEAKTTRGNHYHKKTVEILHVLKGELDLYFANKKNPKKILKKLKIKKGQTVRIMPNQFHWSYNKNKSQWINFLTKKFNKKKPDININ